MLAVKLDRRDPLPLLREQGLLESGRRRGVTVAGSGRPGTVLARTRHLVRQARQHGHDRAELIGMIGMLAD